MVTTREIYKKTQIVNPKHLSYTYNIIFEICLTSEGGSSLSQNLITIKIK